MKINIKNSVRRTLLKVIDFAIVMCSSVIAYLILKRMIGISMSTHDFWGMNVLFASVSVIFMWIFGSYKYIWRFVDARELINCAFSITSGWFVAGTAVVILGFTVDYPETHILFTYVISMFMIILSRIVYKSAYAKISAMPYSVEKNIRTLVVGAGYAGHVIISEMLRPECAYLPVVVVDDDREKKGR